MRLSSLIAAVAVFAACTSSNAGSGAGTPTATPAPTTEPTAVAPAVPTPVPPPVVYRDETFEVKVTDAVTYGKALAHGRAGEVGTAVDLTLDVYEPIDAGDAPRPAIIIVHGGGFDFNNSKSNAFPFYGRYFASRGWVAFSINYRLSGAHGTVPAGWGKTLSSIYPATRDAKAAVRWMRDRAHVYHLDPERITALGASAGALVTLALGTVDEGDYRDELSLEDDWTLATTNLEQSSGVATVIDQWGTLSAVTRLEELSPGDRVDSGDAPVLIIHGTEDGLVLFSRGLEVQAAFTAVGVPVELQPIDGAGHSPFSARLNDGRPQTEAMLEFMVEHQGLDLR